MNFITRLFNLFFLRKFRGVTHKSPYLYDVCAGFGSVKLLVCAIVSERAATDTSRFLCGAAPINLVHTFIDQGRTVFIFYVHLHNSTIYNSKGEKRWGSNDRMRYEKRVNIQKLLGREGGMSRRM